MENQRNIWLEKIRDGIAKLKKTKKGREKIKAWKKALENDN